ncbi:hypothetical protein FB45DRAFT_930874 [Roridomyces roridus]|uniref:Uncharacterized protein n=1 Tax=Roridomyces roridus TaxID=1738132 RepID=A0AAD7BFP5_9AGAR|nr:hypothetical protein FB45DRAFT_930874 [Roridomyces roridus]
MCLEEVVTDRHTACGHLVVIYPTGNTTDCGNGRCKTSSAHTHTAPDCGCVAHHRYDPRIRNVFRTFCPTCQEAMEPPPSSHRRR